MITLKVDKKTCRSDARCVEICPFEILRMNEKDGVPEFIPGGGEMCINCGHCFAFCPPGSIELSTMNPGDSMRLDYSSLPSPEQVEMFLKGRRSIRIYKDQPVTKEAIEKLLDCARYAPSGINRQPVSWLVINGKEKVREIAASVIAWMEELAAAKSPMVESFRFDRLIQFWKEGKDLICRNAPCLITAYGAKGDTLAPQSCTISGTYLELAAFGFGLGACWAGYVHVALNMSDNVRKVAGLPAKAEAGAAMMVGHSKYRFSRIPSRNAARVIWKGE
jgi:nitroreductase/NAD-dependent dihydropyrimidine dehydrogenase PreA subunit